MPDCPQWIRDLSDRVRRTAGFQVLILQDNPIAVRLALSWPQVPLTWREGGEPGETVKDAWRSTLFKAGDWLKVAGVPQCDEAAAAVAALVHNGVVLPDGSVQVQCHNYLVKLARLLTGS